jgi:hypothetical protein
MKLTSYTAKKGIVERLTTKTKEGGFDSREDSAEVTITYEGDKIDPKEIDELTLDRAEYLLHGEPKWLRQTKQEKLIEEIKNVE